MGQVTQDSKAAAYIPISVSTLIPARFAGMALYLPGGPNGGMQLYRGSEVPLEEAALSKLLARDVSTLFLRSDEHASYQQYLRDNLEIILSDESVSPEIRFSSLNTVVRDVLAAAFRSGDAEETVHVCHELSQNTVEMICRGDIAEADLLSIMHHDYHTFTHSANVSYYAVLLAKALQIQDERDLIQVAVGGMLHDLGKLDVPDKILNKPGRLDDDERDIVRLHPRTGFRKLCQRKDLSFGQLMMVYQHHECLDGRGYPVGICGAEIHEWARVCRVADVFEALTSNRPYRAAISSDRALEIMDRGTAVAFDKEMLKCWKSTIQAK